VGQIICPCVGDTHIRVTSSSGSHVANTTFGTNINYGAEAWYQYGFESEYMSSSGGTVWLQHQTTRQAILQFDVAAIVPQLKVTRVRLVQNRSAVHNAGLNSSIDPITISSGDINIERRVTWDNFVSIAQRHTARRITEIASTATGAITTDITAAFSRDLIQSNIFSLLISLSWGTYSNHSREFAATHPHLIIDTEPVPGPPPINLLPTAARNPRAPITFSWWHEITP